MTNYDVVKKLIGEISPIGESHVDSERFSNLENTLELVELLLNDINMVSKKK